MKSSDRRKLEKRRQLVTKMSNNPNFGKCLVCKAFVKVENLLKHYKQKHNMTVEDIDLKARYQRQGFEIGARVAGSNLRKVTK